MLDRMDKMDKMEMLDMLDTRYWIVDETALPSPIGVRVGEGGFYAKLQTTNIFCLLLHWGGQFFLPLRNRLNKAGY